MKRKLGVAAGLFWFCLWVLAAPGGAQAGVQNGLGLFLLGGGLKISEQTTAKEYGRTSFGVGMDYQWALGEAFSLALFGSDNVGRARIPGQEGQSDVKTGAVGLQFRLWMGPLFMGFHRGVYAAAISEKRYSTDFELSNRRAGRGFVLGLEGPGGWSIIIQGDEARGLEMPAGSVVDLVGLRLGLGYRWK